MAKKMQRPEETERYRKLWLGIAHHRAAQFKEAISVLKEFEAENAWAVLAMAHHQLGQAEEAGKWLQKAKDWNDAVLRQAVAGPALKPIEWTNYAHFLIYFREARALIEKSAAKDEQWLAFQTRAREELAKRDKATWTYDHALFLQPDQPRHWRARGLRYIELKQWDKAMADLQQAVAKGYRDITWLKTSPDLAPLRSREDFKKLIETRQE
jgi:tetratricopeptide (TPR) repeat protein